LSGADCESKTGKKRSTDNESSFEGDAASESDFGLSEVQILVLIGLRQGKLNKTIAYDLHIDDQDVVRACEGRLGDFRHMRQSTGFVVS
jgi:hypothetical protein